MVAEKVDLKDEKKAEQKVYWTAEMMVASWEN